VVARIHAAADDDTPDAAICAWRDPDLRRIEAEMLAHQPATIEDVYRRLLALCPTLATDLFAPELAPLRAEIEALINAEVS
jgi:hypothetical protein